MQYNITAPSHLQHTAKLPASKSISNRALIIHALSGGKMLPENLSNCDDTEVIVAAMRDNPYEINIKAAGTAMRFMTAYLAVKDGEEHVLTGTERMKHRPISVLVDALRFLGADIQYVGEEGFPPLRWSDYETIEVRPTPYKERAYYIENDWSGASYWYEIVALSKDPEAEVRLEGLMDGSKQGDSSLRYIFSLLGVKSKFDSKQQGVPTTVTIKRSGHCVPRLEYDFVNSPDLAQTFVVTCALLNVPFHFRGLATLKIKETDRIEALKNEMRKLGYVLKSLDDSELIWDGERCEPDMENGIDTYEDHRMALSFAPAACVLDRVLINNPQVVTKSYPNYWEDIKAGGFEVKVHSS